MKKLTQSFTAKVIGIVLFVLSCCVLLACGIFTYLAARLELYNADWNEVFAQGSVPLMTLYDYRYVIIIGFLVSIVLVILFWIYLLCAAGHHAGTDRPRCNTVDRIPLEIFLAGEGIAFIGLWIILNSILSVGSIPMDLTLGAMGYILLVLCALLLTMSVATRCKTHTFWKNTLAWRVLRLFHRLFYCIPAVWKGVLILLALWLQQMIVIMIDLNRSIWFLMVLLEGAVIFVAAVFAMYQMQKLQEAGEEIARGNLQYQIDTSKMFGALKQHGDNLNNIGQGIAKAVEQKMKSERFKTELITNVSHDIKTPLTSIINYVDLLKKEELPNEAAREYLEVLDRQSARLKKLTEDLVEASKASTGNLPVNAVPTEVGMMLEQAVGEYDERLRASQLETVMDGIDQEAYILADGRLLWRVLDNMMSNTCKYAMPGTRFYVTMKPEKKEVRIILRNISKYPLNVSSEELMHRFVRGDASRTTEGSGLGLSIAQSLTQLQKGTLQISVDGDLFKAELVFPRIYVQKPADEAKKDVPRLAEA